MEIIDCRVKFQVKSNDHWINGDEAIEHISEISEPLPDCGFFIYSNGKPWNTEEQLEGVFNAYTWFTCIEKLLDGEESWGTFVWEETKLRPKRVGNTIELEDHWHGDVLCPLVRFDFVEFVMAMIEQGCTFKRFCFALKVEFVRRGYNPEDFPLDTFHLDRVSKIPQLADRLESWKKGAKK